MAKPAKRKINSDASGSEDDATKPATKAGTAKTTSDDKSAASSTPKQPRVSKRVTVPGAKQGARTDGGSGRVTAGRNTPRPSPPWVPVLMFSLWALGLVLIMLNYMEVLPNTDGLSGWYLVAGLGSILGGILVATQYR